jgi:hypothetical protein
MIPDIFIATYLVKSAAISRYYPNLAADGRQQILLTLHAMYQLISRYVQ